MAARHEPEWEKLLWRRIHRYMWRRRLQRGLYYGAIITVLLLGGVIVCRWMGR